MTSTIFGLSPAIEPASWFAPRTLCSWVARVSAVESSDSCTYPRTHRDPAASSVAKIATLALIETRASMPTDLT